MRVLGISSGRTMGNSEILLRKALMGAKEAGAEIELIRLNEYEMYPCEGCSGCEQKPTGNINCVLHKDDFPVIIERIYEADAIILSAPIYTWAPNGLMRILGDRIGPYHDVEILRLKGYEREDSPIDQRVFKRRLGAYITVSGSNDKRYSSMGVTMMNQVIYPLAIQIVDQVSVFGAYMPGQCLENESNLERVFELGKNVVTELNRSDRAPKWYADNTENCCPECHNDLFGIYPEEKKVYCGNCAIEGTLTPGENGTTELIFTPAAMTKSRFRLSKMGEHAEFIVGGMSEEVVVAKREIEKGYLESQRLRYRAYQPPLIKPEKKGKGV